MGRAINGHRKKRMILQRSRARAGRSRASVYRKPVMEWCSSAARCQGSSHIASGVPCQDQVFTYTSQNGVSVVALSDGAGSAKLSHYGAFLVASRSAYLVADKFDSFFKLANRETPIQSMLVKQLQHEIAQLATLGINLSDEDRERLGHQKRDTHLLIPCSPRDLSATLLLVAIKGNRYVAIHLGDGVVGYEYIDSRGKKRLESLSNPNNGEFANETIFITSSSAANSVKLYMGRICGSRKRVTGFILMSDGPEASLYHKPTKRLAPACGKLLEACRTLPADEMEEQLRLALVNVVSKKTSDDCSIALLAVDNMIIEQ